MNNVTITRTSALTTVTVTTITPAGPSSLAQLQTTWRQIVSRSTGKRHALATAGVNHANRTATQGTAAWYAAAIWRYNQGRKG